MPQLVRQREGIQKAKVEGGRAPTAQRKATDVKALAAEGMAFGSSPRASGAGPEASRVVGRDVDRDLHETPVP